eukprot:scaffold44486_cov46-Attheya_sp.AAC.2
MPTKRLILPYYLLWASLHFLFSDIDAFVVVNPMMIGPGTRYAYAVVRGQSKQGDYNQDDDRTSSFEDSDNASSKGLVSSLTNIVNFFMDPQKTQMEEPLYDCRFTDPTLSFVGTDKFVSNVQNLRPIVDLLAEKDACQSDLLDISINEEEGYVQSRWNMVGRLTSLPWKPKIDVIGRTKFWYRTVNDESGDGQANTNGVRVYFYDECWEIPASQALLQLITPADTIPNQPK